MIKLKIKDAGHTIAIPGLNVFRSPVEVDISKLDIRVVAMYLKTSGIQKYEIVAETDQGIKETYTRKDFDLVEKKRSEPKLDDVDKRFNKLEKMMEILLARELSKTSPDKEQINNKLNRLEKLLKSGAIQAPKDGKVVRGEPEIEELDSFIPEVDVSDMKLKSDNIKTVKQDSDDLEDSADMLSGLIRRG